MVIDKATFERMLSGFEIFAEKVERLCREQEDLGEKEWLDSDDVCRLLCISPRTLQTMRENGTLAYTKISHKVYYRPEDVKAVFPVAEMKRCITAGKERKCNVTNKPTNEPTNKPTIKYKPKNKYLWQQNQAYISSRFLQNIYRTYLRK